MLILRKLFAIISLSVAATAYSFTSNAPAGELPSNATAEQEQQEMLKRNHHIIASGASVDSLSRDSIRKTIEMFYIDQFRNYQDPQSPYFLMLSKDSKLAMGIGGSVRMRVWGDFSGSIPANGFIPYLIPIPSDPTLRKGIGYTPAGSTLFVRVVGRDLPMGNIIAYMEGKFDGYDNVGFRLKKAYVTLNDWTIGYAPTSFSDPMSQLPTIDGAQPNSYINHTTVLVRWMHSFRKNWMAAASVEFPSGNQFDDADITTSRSEKSYIPDFAGFLQCSWRNGAGHVRLSALARVLTYRDLVVGKNKNIFGWGLHISSVVPVGCNLSVYAGANTGRGYSSYTGALSVAKIDLMPDVYNTGQMYAPQIFGWCAGMKYNFQRNIYACVGFSESFLYARDSGKIPGDTYKYGTYAVANCFWEITPRISVGVEYLHGMRKNYDGSSGSANRVDAMFQLSF